MTIIKPFSDRKCYFNGRATSNVNSSIIFSADWPLIDKFVEMTIRCRPIEPQNPYSVMLMESVTYSNNATAFDEVLLTLEGILEGTYSPPAIKIKNNKNKKPMTTEMRAEDVIMCLKRAKMWHAVRKITRVFEHHFLVTIILLVLKKVQILMNKGRLRRERSYEN